MNDVDAPSDRSDLPEHIQDALKAISHLHLEHARKATVYDQATEQVTSLIGRPRFIAWFLACVAGWLAWNTILYVLHRRPIDPAPYNWLQSVLAVAAVSITSLILAAQRRADEFAKQREQLTLELAILTERKSAKLIELMEELRRDLPNVKNREDLQAQEMATSADTATVLEAIEEQTAVISGDQTSARAALIKPDGERDS